MECRFCKLNDIENTRDNVYKCSYCGYSFEASKWDVFYDTILEMPLSSWLVASMLWFSAMLTGVVFGLGFNSTALSTTTLFLFLYGLSAALYGGSKSVDFFKAIWLWTTKKIRGKKTNFEEIKEEVQKRKKEKIAKEVSSAQVLDDDAADFIETDIRPGEKKEPHIATSFTAGILTVLMGTVFAIIYGSIFPSQI